MNESLIDILMATYNGERFVGEQIESIQTQTYKNWRLLVSDDCSSDETLAVVRRYAAEDDRIRVVSEDVRYGGAKENFLALMAKSDAPYCMFCDQDDVWLPEKVEKSYMALRALEDKCGADAPLLVFCDMKVVDSELKVIHESFERFSYFDPRRLAFRQLLAHNVAAGCCMLFNRCLVDYFCQLDGSGVEMHDWWAMLVAAGFGRIAFVDESLNLYRQHAGNEVGANKYSPIDRARNTDYMVRQFVLSAEQAGAFESCYGHLLSPYNRKAALFLAKASAATSPLLAVIYLVRSGCWKRGLRKVGQVIAVATSPGLNERRER